jgi:hypothetical protein
MIYTTHGLMTAADLDEYRKDYDMDPEPITLADLARELDTTPSAIIDFDATLPPYTGDDMLIDADDADAIREAWNAVEPYGVRDYIPS